VSSYYRAAGDLLDGSLPYRDDVTGTAVSYAGEGAYRYPPAFALLYLPVAHLPFAVAGLLACLLGGALYVATIGAIAHEATPERWPWWLPAIVVVGPLTDWVFGFGNASLLLIPAVVMADLVERRGWTWTAGVLIGVAAAVKLSPFLMIVYYAARGRWSTVRAAFATLVLIGVGSLALPILREATIAYPGVLLGSLTGGEGTHPAHAGLAWLAARLGAPHDAVRLVAVAVTAGAVAATIVAARRLEESRAWPIVVLAAFFAAPSLWPQSGLLLPLVTARLVPTLAPGGWRTGYLLVSALLWATIALAPDPVKPVALWAGAGMLVVGALAPWRVAPRG